MNGGENNCKFYYILSGQYLYSWAVTHVGGNGDTIKQFLNESFKEELVKNPSAGSKEYKNESRMNEMFNTYYKQAIEKLNESVGNVDASKVFFTKFDYEHDPDSQEDKSNCEFSYEGKKYKIFAKSSYEGSSVNLEEVKN